MKGCATRGDGRLFHESREFLQKVVCGLTEDSCVRLLRENGCLFVVVLLTNWRRHSCTYMIVSAAAVDVVGASSSVQTPLPLTRLPERIDLVFTESMILLKRVNYDQIHNE